MAGALHRPLGKPERREGYLTAGHVAPPDPNPTLAWVDLAQPPAGSLTARVHGSTVPAGIGSGVAGNLAGAVDAAIIETGGPIPTGLGAAGSAGCKDTVTRITQATGPNGGVIGYARSMPPRRVLGPTVTW